MRNSTKQASSASRNAVRKELLNKTSNRTNFNQTQNMSSMYYSKNNMSFKKELSSDTPNSNTNVPNKSGLSANQSYMSSKKPSKKNATNLSCNHAVTSRINNNIGVNSANKFNQAPATNFMNYKVLSQNTTQKSTQGNSNSFNMPSQTSNNVNSFIGQSGANPTRKKLQNHLLMSHLSNSVRNESFIQNETNGSINYFNYMNQGTKSKQHTPELSKRNIDIESSLYENQKEKQFMDSNYVLQLDKTEENILRIFQEHNLTGRQVNTTLLRQIIKDNPELFENRKSKASTKDDSIKNTNYNTKNIESDSIEAMHFMFVNFFQKSRLIVQVQENSENGAGDNYPMQTVCPCEEVDIE